MSTAIELVDAIVALIKQLPDACPRTTHLVYGALNDKTQLRIIMSMSVEDIEAKLICDAKYGGMLEDNEYARYTALSADGKRTLYCKMWAQASDFEVPEVAWELWADHMDSMICTYVECMTETEWKRLEDMQ